MSDIATTIRFAVAEDSLSIRSLARRLATSFTIDDDLFDEIFNRLMGDGKARILVSTDGEGVVNGYLLGFVHEAFFANGVIAWIEEMYVSDSARLKGIGLSLERAFEAWARELDAKLIALATRRASSFYRAIGYEESAVYFRRLL